MPTPLEIYREALKKRREQDEALAPFVEVPGMELPEAELSESGEPVKTPQELAMEEAAELDAKLNAKLAEEKINKKARKLNDSEYSDFNLKDASNNDNYEDALDQLSEKSAEGIIDDSRPIEAKPVVIPEEELPKRVDLQSLLAQAKAPVEPAPQDRIKDLLARARAGREPAREPEVDLLAEARREKRMADALAMITGGAAKFGAGLGLTGIEPDLDLSKQLRKEGEEKLKEAKEAKKLALAEKKAEAKLTRQQRLDDLNQRYKVAQITKLTTDISAKDKLSSDPNSKESKDAQEKLYKAGFKGDLSGFSEQDVKDMGKSLVRKIVTPIQEAREARLAEKQAWQIDEKDEVSDKQLESISKVNELQDMSRRIKELKRKVNTGVYSQSMHEMGRFLPGDFQDPDQAALTQLVGSNLADYVKSISGAAVSEEEAQRLAKNIPEMGDDDKIFNRKLNEFDKTLKELLDRRQINMKKYQGRKIPGESGIREVERRTKDGRIAVFDADSKKFIRYK